MTGKVLGFVSPIEFARDDMVKLKGNQLVPVRLASESVDLKKLKEYRKSYIKDNQYIEGGLVSTILDDLIEWAEKEAKKK